MNAFEINTAGNLHKLFMIELKSFVLGIQTIDENQLKNNTRNGLTQLLVKEKDKNEELQVIEALNNEINTDAKTIYLTYNQGNVKTAKEEFKQFEKKSKNLLTLLENYKDTLTTNNSITE